MNETERQIALFKALTDANRLDILRMLRCGELCACKILEQLAITQPTLSHHMKVLCDCGMVSGRRDGVWMHYSMNPAAVREAGAFLQRLIQDVPGCAEQPQDCYGAESADGDCE
jgi:ArsR family transcriptional regulator